MRSNGTGRLKIPRSSGVYSLPAGSTISNGDTSDATDLNTPLSDIETDLNTARPIVAGGTGATTASAARTALGLAIGTDVQAYDAGLASIAGLTTAADKMIYTTASDNYAVTALTTAGRAILDDADASAQRTTLGLGTAAVAALIDEDDMSSDDATALPSQQSVKAYVDNRTPQFTESFTTATTTLSSNIPLDATAPGSSEGIQVASIGSVVVATGDQVEIQVDLSAFGNDDALIVALFRDSTCICARVCNQFASVDAGYQIAFTHVDDDPGAATYTYSLRAGQPTQTTCELNALSLAGGQQFTTGTMKSGMRLRVLPA